MVKMMNKRRSLIVLLISVVVILTACSIESAEPTPNIAGTAAAMAETIVAVQMTKIAEEATPTLAPSETPTPEPTNTPTSSIPTLFPTPLQPASGNSGKCLLAHMVSETVPDGTEMAPGEQFNKIWVLQNTGTCTWTSEFSVVFHHSETLGAATRINFPGTVAPGESFSLTVPMVAPAVSGKHLSFWNLESADGTDFGTTTSGLFWVNIVVNELIPPKASFDIWAPTSRGGILFTGETNKEILVGDTRFEYPWQGFATFDLWNIPANATITDVYLIYEGSTITGSPFAGLGCMGVYRYNYGNLEPSDFYNDTPGGALWSFCSAGEISSGVSRYGGAAAISAIQNSLGGKIQFRFQFNSDTDNNSTDDYAKLFPVLRIEYTAP